MTSNEINSRLRFALRSLGADPAQLPEIPKELADYIAKLTPEDLERIRNDVKELERLGLLPNPVRTVEEAEP